MLELDKDIFWDETADIQSEATQQWLLDNVMNRLGAGERDENLIVPELDEWNRPYKWEYKAKDCAVVVEREYISPVKWAKKQDKIYIKINE